LGSKGVKSSDELCEKRHDFPPSLLYPALALQGREKDFALLHHLKILSGQEISLSLENVLLESR
jgi:hypothetical protein